MQNIVSKLSVTSKDLAGSLFSDPQKMENVISMVRTVAPLTSAQTVTKLNTYLPMIEKASTLLGMYYFLSRAQNFQPIQPLNTDSPLEAMTALMKNKNVSKMLAKPLLANNMDKIVGSLAANMLKNGNLNELLSSFTGSADGSEKGGSSMDINSLMETFMPLLSTMSANSNDDKENDQNTEEPIEPMFENESSLYDEEPEGVNEYNRFTYPENTPPRNEYDRYYRNDRYDNYEKSINYNTNRNNYTERKEPSKPIRIKQRKRR